MVKPKTKPKKTPEGRRIVIRKALRPFSLTTLNSVILLADQHQGEWSMFRCLLWAIAAAVRPKARLIADNLCLRQQLLVDADRRFWVLACWWFVGWRTSVLIVKPETVLRWHRHGCRTYWRRRSSRKGKPGQRPIAPELRTLIRRMTIENPLI
jgi:hypothetical protein